METRKTKNIKKPIFRGLTVYYSVSGGAVDIEKIEKIDTKGFNYVCTSGEPLPKKTEEEIISWALMRKISKKLQNR